MSKEELEQIRARAEVAARKAARDWNGTEAYQVCTQDVPALINELERLRQVVAKIVAGYMP